MMQYYIKAFKNYCNSSGRATRKELWLFFLFHFLVIFILAFLDGLIRILLYLYTPRLRIYDHCLSLDFYLPSCMRSDSQTT